MCGRPKFLYNRRFGLEEMAVLSIPVYQVLCSPEKLCVWRARCQNSGLLTEFDKPSADADRTTGQGSNQ
jgi:hypothetical protein